jgi:hypothetical protein
MTTWARGLWVAAAVMAFGLVAGCASQPVAPVPPAAITDAVNCSSGDASDPVAGRVPDGFIPVDVYRCNTHAMIEDAQGRWSAIEVEHLTGDLRPLLEALATPDDARTGGVCPAMAELVRELWLADVSGNAIRVHYPRTACGFTKPAVNAALELLTVVDTRKDKLRVVESRAAMDAGCATLASPLRLVTGTPPDGIVLEGGIPGDRGISSVPAYGGSIPGADEIDVLRVCRYERDAAASADQAALEGTFVGAGELRGEQVRLVLAAAAAGTTAAEPCTTEAKRFTVLLPVRAEVVVAPAITVELDGCRRISSLGTLPRVAPAEVLGLVS